MQRPTPKPFSEHRPWLAVAQAYGRAAWRRRRLPPGDLVDIGELERGHRRLLLERAERYGPVFKAFMERRLVVCVVGHALGRRLLRDHAESLRGVSIQVQSLFPHGFIRGMEGELHRDYRRLLSRALSAVDLRSYAPRFETIVREALVAHAQRESADGSPSWAETLGGMADRVLIAYFFGKDAANEGHERLLSAYRRLGPHGLVWNIKRQQIDGYQDLLKLVDGLGGEVGGVLGTLRSQGRIDATVLGNVIYMVELGRYDVGGLLRWISRYAADHPAWLARIAADPESPAGGENGDRAAEAFVLETLRMDKSERLMRDVEADIVFDGWLIPRGALVRVCMWEGHRDDRAFPRPFTFDPARFLSDAPGVRDFAPFGLDHHHCPLADPVMQIAVTFLRVLAREFVIHGRDAEPPVRGPYHWEPSPRFEVDLERRPAGGNGR